MIQSLPFRFLLPFAFLMLVGIAATESTGETVTDRRGNSVRAFLREAFDSWLDQVEIIFTQQKIQARSLDLYKDQNVGEIRLNLTLNVFLAAST